MAQGPFHLRALFSYRNYALEIFYVDLYMHLLERNRA